MKSLDQFNTERAAEYWKANDPSPRPNGIACPKCGRELLDSNPMMILASMPPQKNVHCPKEGCGYVGYRIA